MKKNFVFIFLVFSIQVITACDKENPYLEDIMDAMDFGDTFTRDSTKQNKDSINNINTPNDSLNKDSIISQDSIIVDSTETIVELDTTRTVLTLAIQKYMDVSSDVGEQGASVFGDYLFQFLSHEKAVYIYNLKTKKLEEYVSYDLDRICHCTNASFSNVYYDSNDEFPLLYVSGSNVSIYNYVQVFRVEKNNGFKLTHIQEIVLPQSSEKNNLYWQNVVMDNENNFMYVYASTNGAQIAKFNIPDFRIPIIKLTDKDILDQYSFETFRSQQGAVIKNGYLYVCQGIPHKQHLSHLRIIDLVNKTQIYKFDLLEMGFGYETEGLAFYQNKLLVTTYGGNGIFTIKYRVKKEDNNE